MFEAWGSVLQENAKTIHARLRAVCFCSMTSIQSTRHAMQHDRSMHDQRMNGILEGAVSRFNIVAGGGGDSGNAVRWEWTNGWSRCEMRWVQDLRHIFGRSGSGFGVSQEVGFAVKALRAGFIAKARTAAFKGKAKAGQPNKILKYHIRIFLALFGGSLVPCLPVGYPKQIAL